MKQWDRQYRFAVGKAGGAGFEIGEQSRMAPHIYFNVQKQDASTANTSKITLWNLNAPHLAALNEKDCVVTLKAGYGSAMPLLFVGAVTHIETMLDGADRMTEIEAVDGRIELRDTFVSLSYKGKISTKKIIEAVAGEMGIPVTFSHNAKFTDLPNGYSYIGAENDTAKNTPGYEIVYLLNGAIGVGDYVKVESEKVTGYFRVDTVEHDGDNLEGDWLSTARVYEV
ncbi:hypothetical protein FACS1894208_07270 [Clostridia bacterium]|nr:hypothetical protein FACS1894208_07270 [Clostridia bacterium]